MTRTILALSILLLAATSLHAADPPPIPSLDKWKQQAVVKGKKACDAVMTAKGDGPLAGSYYDAILVYRHILEQTGEPSTWQRCVDAAKKVYRDGYVAKALKEGQPGYGYVPGYWNFTRGLRRDYEVVKDAASREAVRMLANNGAFASGVTSPRYTESADASRETAYAILAHLNTEALGDPKVLQQVGDASLIGKPRRPLLVNHAYGHFDQWFTRFCWKPGNACPEKLKQFSPFMVGLSAYALIKDWEVTKDPRLIPALRLAADWLWANAWLPSERGMFYDALNGGMGKGQGAPDLNLLIAPMYGFLYRQTGEAKYRDQGDALFAGGVDLAWLDGPKQFNQSYMLSPEYVLWRQAGPAAPPAAFRPLKSPSECRRSADCPQKLG